MLAPGLHLFVAAVDENFASAWGVWPRCHGCRRYIRRAPCHPSVSSASARNGQKRLYQIEGDDGDEIWKFIEHVDMVMKHEIGHILGIGIGPDWWTQLQGPDSVNSRPYNYRLANPAAIAALDKMGSLPPTTAKVPVAGDRFHWDGCAGHFDLMGNHRRWWTNGNGSYITELTMAALRDGYSYNTAYVRPKTLETDRWNYQPRSPSWRCKDGQYYPLGTTGSLQRQHEIANLENDVIRYPR